MALTAHSTLHFASGHTLDVVETIAQICAIAPAGAPYPYGLTVALTIVSGAKVWVNLIAVEMIEPK